MSRLHQITEPERAAPQDGLGPLHVPHRGAYLRSGEAADFLGYGGRHKLRSLYRFLKQHGIVPIRRGAGRRARLLIKKAELLAALPGRCVGE